MAIKLNSHIPIEVEIGESEKLKLAVKRLTFQELVELRSKYREVNKAGDDSDTLLIPVLQDAFERYVRIDSEVVVELADGEETLRKAEGGKLLQAIGGNPSVVMRIFLSIIAQSSLSALEKKRSASPIASSPSSDERETDPVGEKPETTATSAESGDSAGNGDAPAPLETSQSGSMDGETTAPPSSSTPVPSVH